MKRAWCVFALVLAACNIIPGTPLIGVWRSINAEVTLSEQGGNIIFGCAFGTFDTPIRPDLNGNFQVNGTFTISSPVQPPPDVPPPTPQPAVYSGKITGNTLTFEGTLGNGSKLGAVTVVKDGTQNVVICA